MTPSAKAAWHLIAGPTGSGKSTRARTLADELGAARLSIDDWMTTLYWMDCPLKNDMAWALERVSRCEQQIAEVVTGLVRLGLPAVLDLGFSQASQRAAWLNRAAVAGVPLILHLLEPPAELRWRRVQQRNTGESQTFSFEVTRAMFDEMEGFWQSPDAAERSQYVEVLVDN